MKKSSKILSLLLAVIMILSSLSALAMIEVFAANSISYSFSKSDAGYAQGTITLKGDNGTYYLYWADNTKALADYGEITKLTVSGGQGSFAMPQYTAIPTDATKLIAFKASSEPTISNRTVAKASAVYNIPASKLLAADTKDALYTFGAISDPQLDNQSTTRYPYDEVNLAAALETLAKRGVDFTVSSGDTVNDQDGPKSYAAEYKTYQRILADSSYSAPIYEALGNHDVGSDWYNSTTNNNAPFIKATGLDSKKSTIDAGKPYFEVTEPTTGDHFIFMALEGGFYTNKNTQFSSAQLDWLEGLLKKYSSDGKNIFIIEHANIGGWGSGDKLTTPYYYDLALVKTNSDVNRFVKLMEKYKDCVIITGHTHLELSAQYNYSDNNGTSAVMMHNSAIGGVRRLVNGTVVRDAVEGLSEGYIVEVYKDFILFNGTNMYYNETMPQCCYIIPMSTSANPEDNTKPEETKPQESIKENVTITLKDSTGSGWMKNNASEREIQLIDNDTNKKYIMTSSDGYKTWTVEVPRSVTDITFKRVRMSDNVDRNVWTAGERNGSVLYHVQDDAGGGTTAGVGYWDTGVTEPKVTEPEEITTISKPVITEPEEITTATKPVVTEPEEITTISKPVITEPEEITTASKPVVTEPEEITTASKPVITEPEEITTASKPVVTEPEEITTASKPVVTEPEEITTASKPVVTEPEEITTATKPVVTEPEEITTISKPIATEATQVTATDVTETTAVETEATSVITEITAVAESETATAANTDPANYVYGDVDLNEKINIKDATIIRKYAAKLLDIEGVAFVQAEVTGDGKVNIKDATEIQKYCANLIEVFPAEGISMVSVGAAFGGIATVKADLESYYTYSSYDQYMALKKAYTAYKDKSLTTAQQNELMALQQALYDIAGGNPSESSSEITIYFTNTNGWSKVCAHIWGTAGDKAVWPGTQMTFVRNNSSGKGIYKITFDYNDYQKIIFNNNNQNEQTVDITLTGESGIGYYISGGSGKALTVTSYTYGE